MEGLVPEAGNLENFIKQFEVFARAPGGVDELRVLILQIAVMGKLVENSNDNSERLLNSLKEKKDQLIRSKAVKQLKKLGEVTENEKRFSIPSNWLWTRATDIFDIRDGTHDSPKHLESGYPLVTSKNISSGQLDLTNVKYISEEDHKKISERSKVDKKDILFAMIGSIGNPVIINVTPDFSVKNVGLFKYYDLNKSVPEFLLLYLKLASVWMKEEASGAVQSFVSLGKLRSLPVPLPPLEEQKRIVAKVDELMSLCATLEAQQQQQAQTVLRANTAAINALLNPAPQSGQNSPKTTEKETNTTSENSFENNWQRIAQHFSTLYGCTLPMAKGQGRKKKHLVGLENVKALRQVIAELALKGMLTKRGEGEKISLTKIRDSYSSWATSKKHPLLPSIKLSDNNLPKLWIQTQLGNIIAIKSGDGLTKSQMEVGKVPVYGGNGVTGYHSSGNVKNKTIVIGRVGYYCGSVHLTEKLSWITDNAFLTSYPEREINRDFLVLLLKNSNLQQNEHSTAQPVISGKKVYPIMVSLPPLEEQKRIVTKVDQLTTLCDQLEQQLTQSYSDAEKLMQATVKTLVA